MKATTTTTTSITADYKAIAIALNGIDLAIDKASTAFAKAWDRLIDGKAGEVELAAGIIEGCIVAFYSEYTVRCNLKTLAMAAAGQGMNYPDFSAACKKAIGTVDKDGTCKANFDAIKPWTNASYSQQARPQFEEDKQGKNVGRGGGGKQKLSDFAKAKKMLEKGNFTAKQVESLVLLLTAPAVAVS